MRARPHGWTLRRAVEQAVIQPHPGSERFDPDFPIAMRCQKCGRVGHGPRSQMQEALRDHMQSECPARKSHADQPQVTQILYPRI